MCVCVCVCVCVCACVRVSSRELLAPVSVIIRRYLAGREYKYPLAGSPYGRCKYLWPGSLASVIIWLCSEWRPRKYLLAWVALRRLLYGCTLYGVSVIAFGLGLLASVIIWLYSVWRQRKYLRHGSPCVGYHLAELCVASA